MQERYLSEYNYDEPIDEDRAKNLLNFGDDYRNFIDSLSESYSSISSMSLDRRQKKSKRLRKRTVTHRPEEAALHRLRRRAVGQRREDDAGKTTPSSTG